jgi:hypothetical protein
MLPYDPLPWPLHDVLRLAMRNYATLFAEVGQCLREEPEGVETIHGHGWSAFQLIASTII